MFGSAEFSRPNPSTSNTRMSRWWKEEKLLGGCAREFSSLESISASAACFLSCTLLSAGDKDLSQQHRVLFSLPTQRTRVRRRNMIRDERSLRRLFSRFELNFIRTTLPPCDTTKSFWFASLSISGFAYLIPLLLCPCINVIDWGIRTTSSSSKKKFTQKRKILKELGKFSPARFHE